MTHHDVTVTLRVQAADANQAVARVFAMLVHQPFVSDYNVVSGESQFGREFIPFGDGLGVVESHVKEMG